MVVDKAESRADNPANRVWRVSGSNDVVQDWLWDDTKRRFITVTLSSSRSVVLDLDGDDVDCVRPNRTSESTETCEACRTFLPKTFKWCPACGGPLKSATTWSDVLWSGPSGHTSGFARVEHAVSISTKPEKFALPAESDALTFICGGTPARLLAIDRELGQTYAYSETRGRWRRVDNREGYHSKPSWSWSVAATERGIFFPTEQSPAWIEVTTLGFSPTELPNAADLECAGGIGIGEDMTIYVPCKEKRSGRFRLLRIIETDGQDFLDIENTDDLPRPSIILAPPVRNEAGHIFWPSVEGYLATWRAGKHELVCWRSWENEASAVPHVRPCRDGNDPYQLVHNAEGYAYQSLVAQRREIDSQPVDGPCFSADNVHFRDGKRLQAPWQGSSVIAKEFIVPLLRFSDERTISLRFQDLNDRGRLLNNNASFAQGLADLYWTTTASLGDSLNLTFAARSLDDVSIFLFGSWLYAYHSSNRQCWRWRCEPA